MIYDKIKNIFFKTNKIWKQEKGLALIMVISTVLFIILMIQETIFETQVEHRSATTELRDLQAYHSAKSGIEMGLLRVKTYNKIVKTYKEKIDMFRSYVDMIWRFPFIWPPLLADTEEKAELSSSLKEDISRSFMKASYHVSIEPTVGRIDINDLASPLPSLRMWTFQILFRLITHLREEDPQLATDMQGYPIVDILNNIRDWVDTNKGTGDGDSYSEVASELDKYRSAITYPSNQSFASRAELHQVLGVPPSLYKALEPYITVFGEKGININIAPSELIQALHPEMPSDVVEEIIKLRNTTINPPVLSQSDFSQLLTERGLDILAKDLLNAKSNNSEIKPNIAYLSFDAPHNFIITSTGIMGQSRKTITAVYVDLAYLHKRFIDLTTQECARQTSSGSGTGACQNIQAVKNTSLSEKPLIIYWKTSL